VYKRLTVDITHEADYFEWEPIIEPVLFLIDPVHLWTLEINEDYLLTIF